ncbi:L,D-transpeptidase family protein [Pseudomonas sp. S 311-6]|uniref:L,D-transpeptidase family protein n=1 Tax=Kerstersia gyiorum TaxID=206506 RepID=UPI002096D91A|nr:L,D-transpeptidase family protein [Pseudomonas sp. S 311-6]
MKPVRRFRQRLLPCLILIALLVLAAFGYTRIMGRVAPGMPPVAEQGTPKADLVRVYKSARRLELWQGATLLASYRIALGGAPDAGHKQQEGDQRTPEGRYVIDWRNPRSRAYLSLHISYPNAQDRQAAAAAGYPPGGDIMIHGLPNGWGALGPIHHWWDWTDGCIGVSNNDMREIWSLVPNGTTIEIAA